MPQDTAQLWGKTDREGEDAIADGGRRRARRLAGIVLLTGLLLLAVIWWVINDIVVEEQNSAIQNAVVDARNLDIAFQAEITRILNADAVAMKAVADRMRAEPGRFDINAWARDIPLLSEATLHASIIGPNGTLQSSTLQEDPAPLDLSDREHFRIHLNDRFKGIYVSRPVRGRLSHQVTIQLSQRAEGADGRFLGVVVFALLPEHLTMLHRMIDLGPHGVMAITGATDGVIRARFGPGSDGVLGTGATIPAERLRDDRPNTFVDNSVVDGVRRLYSKRPIPGYDLVVTVGLGLDDVLAPAKAENARVLAIGIAVSLLLCGLIGVLACEAYRRSRRESELAAALHRRERIDAELRASEARFRDFANLTSDWFWQQDADLRFTDIGAGPPLLGPNDRRHIGKRRWEQSDLCDPPRHFAEHRQACLNHEPFRDFRYSRISSDDRVAHVSVSGVPLFNEAGEFLGYRGTGRDVTAEVEAQDELRAAKERAEYDIETLQEAQFALRESERRVRDFADTSSDWFWEQDAELRFTWISETCPAIKTGSLAYVGEKRWDLPPSSHTFEVAWDEHRATLAARLPFRDFRYALPLEDRSLLHVSVSGTPIKAPDGTFLGYRGTGRDITHEVAAAEELRAAKERAEQAEETLHDAVDSISEGFVIYDRDDRLVLCNEAYRRLYPHNAEIFVPGAKFEDLLSSSLAHGYYPEAVGREAEWAAEFIRAHRAAETMFEQQRPGGSWLLVSERRMRNGGIAGLRMDITALKRAELALRESEARFDRAQEIARIASWELDIASGEYLWSREMYRIRGLSPDTFTPRRGKLARYLHEEDRPHIYQWLIDMEHGIQRDAIDIRIVRPDGTVRICNLEARHVFDSDGKLRKLIGTLQDVTDRRLTEHKLVQAQKMETIGQLSGGMAHDFNNVLSVIIGNLDLLKRQTTNDPVAEELRSEAARSAYRGADLTRRLLAYARRQPLRPRRTSINDLVDGMARMLGRLVGENVMLNLRLDRRTWPVVVDPTQLEAALSNLAANARDAMPNGGRLDIMTRNVRIDANYAVQHTEVSQGDYAVIEVSDSGEGISPDIIGQIFEPFFTTKGPGKGSGLGLSMVFGFIKQSGGHITVHSEIGSGSTFRLYLPHEAHVERDTEDDSDPAAVPGGSETVLVVEDNADLRHVTAQGLRFRGYQVREAETAAAAIDVLKAHDDVQLLFADFVLPGGVDGVDLAVEAGRLRPGLPVLLTSGFPDTRGTGKSEKVVASGFPLLNKPYRHDELAFAVREALDEGEVESMPAE
jgi:PAS domain S-box-containing protein